MILMVLLAVSSCGRDDSFNERYNDTSNEIQRRAAYLDNEVNNIAQTGDTLTNE